jgi:hypothetical protein
MSYVKNWPKAILWSLYLIFFIWGVLVTVWLMFSG